MTKAEIKDEQLREIVDRLIDTYQPEQIFLFGSTARSEAGPDSDYDLMVIVPDNADSERRESFRAYQALWGIHAAADVLVWTRQAFQSRMHLRASLPSMVVREGVLLYAA